MRHCPMHRAECLFPNGGWIEGVGFIRFQHLHVSLVGLELMNETVLAVVGENHVSTFLTLQDIHRMVDCLDQSHVKGINNVML